MSIEAILAANTAALTDLTSHIRGLLAALSAGKRLEQETPTSETLVNSASDEKPKRKKKEAVAAAAAAEISDDEAVADTAPAETETLPTESAMVTALPTVTEATLQTLIVKAISAAGVPAIKQLLATPPFKVERLGELAPLHYDAMASALFQLIEQSDTSK